MLDQENHSKNNPASMYARALVVGLPNLGLDVSAVKEMVASAGPIYTGAIIGGADDLDARRISQELAGITDTDHDGGVPGVMAALALAISQNNSPETGDGA